MSTATEQLDLITAVEAAAIIGVSRWTFDSWVAAGLAPVAQIRIGKTIRWSRSELAEWLAAGAPPRAEWEARRKGRRKAR